MLTVLAIAAVGLALGGGFVAHWRTADQMAISLLRDEAVCAEAARAVDDSRLDDWGREYWFEERAR